jgi:hypothetical protein
MVRHHDSDKRESNQKLDDGVEHLEAPIRSPLAKYLAFHPLSSPHDSHGTNEATYSGFSHAATPSEEQNITLSACDVMELDVSDEYVEHLLQGVGSWTGGR